VCDGERTGGTNSRDAAEAHRPLPPGWTPGGALSGLDARPCARIPALPPLPYPASGGVLHAWAGASTRPAGRGWAAGSAAPALNPLPTPTAGSAGYAPTSQPPRWGTATATATGFALPAVCDAAPPATCRPCRQGAACRAAAGRLAPLCRVASRAAERPPTPPRACGTEAARLSACFNSRPAPTACGRRCRPVPVTPSRKRRQVLVAISHENHMAARDGITPQCRVPVTSFGVNTVMLRHARYTGNARQTRPRHP